VSRYADEVCPLYTESGRSGIGGDCIGWAIPTEYTSKICYAVAYN